jgi:hypothetical protein
MRLSLFSLIVLALPLQAQFENPKSKLFPPDEKTLSEIQRKTKDLATLLQSAKYPSEERKHIEPLFRIYQKAAVWIVKYNEWFDAKSAANTVEILNEGLKRTSEFIKNNKLKVEPKPGPIALAYQSTIDDSIQPYALVFPEGFQAKGDKRFHLEVILHGRDAKLNEVSFLKRFSNPKMRPENREAIELHVYGRGNNAYRWAGETDVFEAIASAIYWIEGSHLTSIQTKPLVLRGFSMGGAGAWHLGMRHPTEWSSVSPGAGFNTTRGYLKGLPDKLPDYIEKCLHIYDGIDYVENAKLVPLIAYGGELDPQLQSSKNAEAKLKPLGIPATFLVGPKTEHRYHPDSLKEILKLQLTAQKTWRENPTQIEFVTYVPQVTSTAWVHVQALQKTYERATINAIRLPGKIEIKTENVRLVRVQFAKAGQAVPTLIDGTTLDPKVEKDQDGVYLQRIDQKWVTVPESKKPTLIKDAEMTGPIDDAFRGTFVLVEGTGKPWNQSIQDAAMTEMELFRKEWSKYFRGELKVIKDTDVGKVTLPAKTSYIAFGDPGSNSLILQSLSKLPLQWNEKTVTVHGKNYDSKNHLPKLIYPMPAICDYLVINSGHTFHAKDFEGTNALLYPRLGDFAILKLTGKEPELITAGLFDDDWK